MIVMVCWLRATYALRRAGERVLVADALVGLVGLPFDDVGHRVFRTETVHDLLRRVVRIVDERPRHVAEEAALGQLLRRLARLGKQKRCRKIFFSTHFLGLVSYFFAKKPTNK